MGLAASWRQSGLKVSVFKKGPDYIDAAWLEFASGSKARNLDTFMMGAEGVAASFKNNSGGFDVSVIEGNRGLYDGADAEGTHSTAELAKLIRSPVILIQDVTKVTRTVAATVLGCLKLDPDVNIAGVILNRVAGSRHEEVTRRSIEQICGIPVIGAVPRLSEHDVLPGRHLGLVTPAEHPDSLMAKSRAAEVVTENVDIDRVLAIARSAPEIRETIPPGMIEVNKKTKPVRIAYFNDSAFTFYYHDNLEALQSAGAQLIPVSSLKDAALPPCEGLFIGGGFPETHALRLSENRSLLDSVRRAALDDLPIYAECGGLIYLCQSISWNDETYPLAGVFPVSLEMMKKPQGHGYMEVNVDVENPYFAPGTKIRGHEFHYTRLKDHKGQLRTIYNIRRGTGCISGRDGLICRNVLASYMHLHAAGALQWATNFIKLTKNYKTTRT